MPDELGDLETVARANVAISVGQALATYGKADELPEAAPLGEPELGNVGGAFEAVWATLKPGARVSIQHVALSEWVPRIPGLFWQPGASHLRIRGEWRPDERGAYRVFSPGGKSAHVLGGVGTMRLGISPEGWRMGCVAPVYQNHEAWRAGPLSEQTGGREGNTSAGIPIIIQDDVWVQLRLGEGTVVGTVNVPWRTIPTGWAEYFPSIKGIPRGCLVVTDPSQLTVEGPTVHTAIHPFSVMDYETHGGRQLDFVYAQGLGNAPGWREELQTFFEWYRTQEDRRGRFLLGADLDEPLWDAEYSTPTALRAVARADFELLEARVMDPEVTGRMVELLARVLPAQTDAAQLVMIAGDAQVPAGTWDAKGALVDQVRALLAAAVAANRLPGLVDAVQVHLPFVLPGMAGPPVPGSTPESWRLLPWSPTAE